MTLRRNIGMVLSTLVLLTIGISVASLAAAGSPSGSVGAAAAPASGGYGQQGGGTPAPRPQSPGGPAGAPGAGAGPGGGGPPPGQGGPPQRPPAPPTAGQKAEDYYKNIQVLKGVPADQLVPAMQFMSSSLGVDCDYCHVDHGPDKDDKKEKQVARKMITMNLAINKDTFEGKREVTCFSCHRGASRPQAVPAVTENGPEEQNTDVKPPAPAPAGPILDKYLQAAGGAAALSKVTTRVIKGKLSGFGPEPFDTEIYCKAPDKRISIVQTPRGESITAFDGKAGWLANSGRPAHDMSPQEAAAARIDADLRFPADLKSMFKEFRTAPSEKIGDREAAHVIALSDGQPRVDLWFDAQSGLLVRLERYVDTPLGYNPTQIDYADYKDVDGVKVPHRWTVGRPGGSFTIKVDEVKQNVPVDDAKFAKPAAPLSQ